MNSTKKRLLLVTLVILILSGYLQLNRLLSFRFVDEEYNFAIGKYLSSGEKLYEDIITNHQPLTHILSFGVQKLFPANSTYELVANHRKAVILWSSIWSLIIVYYFELGALFFIIIFELTKVQLLGNLFLAESLSVYPIITLIGLTFFSKKEFGKIELILWGICFTGVLFFLAPMYPFSIFIFFLLILKYKNNLSKIIPILGGFLTISFFVLLFISFSGFLYYSLFINLAFTVPSYHSENWFITTAKSIATPFLSFLPLTQTPTLWVIRILSLVLVFNIFQKKSFRKVLILLVVLGLINIRFIQPGTEGYNGFHILPWYGAFVFLSLMILTGKRKKINYFFIFLTILLSFNFQKATLLAKGNIQKDYYINYSTHTSLGDAIRIMKDEKDTLFVSPDAWLIYWQSDTHHLPKLFGYYTWMAGVPSIHQNILKTFEKNPPTFFYCENCNGLDLGNYLNQYQVLKRDGGETYVYVLKEKVKGLTKEQKGRLNYYKYFF